jgi:hypothetical protein
MRVNLVRRSLLLVLVLVGGLSAVPAAEAAVKPYTLNITPASVAGGSRVTFTATFAVPSAAQQSLGSANLKPPAGFTLVSASTGSIVDGVLRLRNFTVAPNTTRTVTVTADVACSAPIPATWAVFAKQSNDFNGTGNDLDLDAVNSTLTTSVTGCGTKICTTSPCTSPSGQSTLAIDVVGGVEPGAEVRLAFGTPGTVGIINCGGYDELTIDEATYDYTGDRAKVATYRIDKSRVGPLGNNGATALQLCYGSPDSTFPTRPGTPAPKQDGLFDWDNNAATPPTDVWVGLLPDCPAQVTTPCISKRQKNQAGDGIITAQLPAGTPGDPKMRG